MSKNLKKNKKLNNGWNGKRWHGWRKAVLLVSPHPYMVQLVPSGMWQSFIGRWIVEAPSDTGAGLQQKKKKKKGFTPMRPFLSNTLKVNVRFYFTELTPLVSAWPGWILPGRRSDERCAVWGVWRIRWDAAGRPARCNPSNLERWNAAETTKCKFTIYIIAGLGVCSCPKAGTALWEKKVDPSWRHLLMCHFF